MCIKKIVLSIFAVSMVSVFVYGGPGSDDPKGLLHRVFTIRAFSARFTQEKYFPDVDETVTFTGTAVVLKPGMAKWMYEKPDRNEILISQDTLYHYVPDLDQVYVIDLTERSGLRAAFGCFVSYSAEEFFEAFTIITTKAEDGGRSTCFDLRPVDPALADYIASVSAWVDTSRALPLRLRIVMVSGEISDTQFHEPAIDDDAGLLPGMFAPDFPDGTTLVSEQ